MDSNYDWSIPFEAFEDSDGKNHIFVCDMDRDYSRWSKSAIEYFGLESEYMYNAGDIWIERIHPDDRDLVKLDIRNVFTGRKNNHKLDYRVLNKNGDYIVCTCRGKVIPKNDGTGKLFVGSIENHGISNKFDSVTGLYNVYAFLYDAKEYRNNEEDKAILMTVGINFFSDINKHYGYEFGNKLLKAFADDLRRLALEKICNIYRMDGTKFCIAIVNGTVQDTVEFYDIIKKAAHNGYDIDGHHISFTVSGGVVDVDDRDVNEFSIQASLGYVLEQSKHRKHSELVIFNGGMEKDSNLVVLEAIRNSVLNDMSGFYLCYQPIIEEKTDTICGMEALLRWKMEPYGEVPPGVFIPWLEQDPCFYQLGSWVMKKALTDAKKIIADNPDFVVNVNVSAEQIERTGFRQSVCDILKKVDFPPQNMCMELTERVVSLDLEYLRGELKFFRDMGIKVALDDFGTGVSSLNLLLELPVDTLKIDRQFVKDITEDKAEQMIVGTIAYCAEQMELDICVEGVETTEMKNFLKQYRIRKHQGYLYSKPVVYDKFVELM